MLTTLLIAALVAAGVWGPAPHAPSDGGSAAETRTITISTDDDITFAEAVALKASPSVVSVAVEQEAVDILSGRTVRRAIGNGSGVIIRSDGYILTNDHVIADADALTVAIGVDELPAQVVGRDPSSDLAVIKVDRTGLPAIEIGSSADLRVGQPVVAIGSPFGLDQSVTSGIISALGRTSLRESAEAQITAYTSLIQTDAAINPGNSGGALTDAQGRLIGINTLIQTGSQYAPQSAGVGFAIPVDYAMQIAEELIATGTARHPYLGISSLTVSPAIAERYGLPVDAGVLVDAVQPGSPAEAAGIKAGDIIVGIGGTRITSVEDVFLAIRSHRVGDVVSVEIVRGAERLTLEATLGSDTRR
jgi:S1-C subfamily serine protease